MVVTLEEMKNYLRVDYEDDDALLVGLIGAAQNLCMDVARTEDEAVFAAEENAQYKQLKRRKTRRQKRMGKIVQKVN